MVIFQFANCQFTRGYLAQLLVGPPQSAQPDLNSWRPFRELVSHGSTGGLMHGGHWVNRLGGQRCAVFMQDTGTCVCICVYVQYIYNYICYSYAFNLCCVNIYVHSIYIYTYRYIIFWAGDLEWYIHVLYMLPKKWRNMASFVASLWPHCRKIYPMHAYGIRQLAMWSHVRLDTRYMMVLSDGIQLQGSHRQNYGKKNVSIYRRRLSMIEKLRTFFFSIIIVSIIIVSIIIGDLCP